MYMAVTPDRLELPIAVGETASELGKMMGVSANLIYSSISKGQSGISRKMKFVKVDTDEEG